MSSSTRSPVSPYAALAQALRAATNRREAEAAFVQAEADRQARLPPAPAARRDSPPAPPPPVDVDQIGIWQRQIIDGETWYVRPPGDPGQLVLWADVERIGPKRGRRVALIGESCARGWPFDPLFNCAMTLRQYLQAVPGGAEVEIVDLAHCSILATELVALTERARALDPDVFIVFAGNNWQTSVRHLDLAGMARLLRETGSWRSVGGHCEETMRKRMAFAVDAIATACRGVPTMVVVPAENALEYEFPPHVCNPLLDSRGQATRDELIAAIDRAFAAGDFRCVEVLAAALLNLEDQVSTLGHQALAFCALARGDLAEARRLFTVARETLVQLPVFGLNSFTIRTEELHAGAARHGFPLVDLPCFFLEENGMRPLGHDLFIDNLHMSAKGIRLAMAATAERLLPMLDLPARSRAQLMSEPVAVPPAAIAQAHIVAATTSLLHDERRMRYHYARAVAQMPAILDVMRLFGEVLLPREPHIFSEALDELTALCATFPLLRGMGGVPARPITPFDRNLARVTTDTLASARPGVRPHYVDLFRRRHALSAGETDLLPYAVFDDFTCAIRGAFLQCFRQHATFEVICGESTWPTRLRLATRTGHSGPPAHVATLSINGVVAHAWPVNQAWTRTDCEIDPQSWQTGPNIVTIHWPDPEGDGDRVRHLASTLDHLAREEPVHQEVIFNIYGLFGHILYGEVSGFIATAPATGRSRGH